MFDKCLFFNLNTFTREINRCWEEEFARLDLSPSHGYFLRLILENPGASQKEVAERLNLAPSTLTRFADALIKKGLIKRVASADDARSISFQPTKKAEALRAAIDEAIGRLTNLLTEKIGSKNVADLVQILRSLQGTLS